jgi:hypothetical protein
VTLTAAYTASIMVRPVGVAAAVADTVEGVWDGVPVVATSRHGTVSLHPRST